MRKPKLYKKAASSILTFLIVFQTAAGIFLPMEVSFSPLEVSLSQAEAAGESWASGYSYRKAITIDHTQVSGSSDLTDFPILINIASDDDLRTTGNGGDVQNANGYDIIFTDSTGGGTKLDHEVEKYDFTTGEFIAYVRIPTLKYNEDTIIYLYYGNSDISTSQENINGVWDANYKMVQHLDETTGTHNDSTSNANNGTANGGMNQDATGKIDGADSFDGTDDFVSVNDSSSLDITDQITVEAWVNPSADGWKYKMPISLSPATPEANYQVKIELTTSNFDYSRAKANGEDLRFYETNGTKLDYWIEEWNASGTSTIWVEVATSGTDTIYMYYGNSGASKESNGENTFEFFEPFDNATLNTDRWTSVDGNPTYSIDAVNHYLEITNMDGYNWQNGKGFHSKILSFPSEWIVEDAYSNDGFGMYHHSSAVADLFGATFSLHHAVYSSTDWGVGFFHSDDSWGDQTNIQNWAGVGGNKDYESGSISPSLPVTYNIKMWKTGGNIHITQDTIERVNEANSEIPDRIHLGIEHYETRGFGTKRFYAFKVRKYSSSEPTATIGNETAAGISKAGSYGIGANTATAFASINGEAITGGTLSLGNWNHIALTYNYLAGGTDEMKLYLNGAQVATGDYATQITTNANDLWMGDLIASAGIIDEVRISAAARSADWILTEYNNQSSPSTFYGVGAEEYLDHLEVTGTGTMTAGGVNELTITAKTNLGNTYTDYTGGKSLTFSGPANAPNGAVPTVEGVNIGSAVTVNFTNGVSDANAATLIAYNAETTTVDVDDGSIDSTSDASYDLDLTVNPAALNDFTVVPSSYSPTTDDNFTVILTARDQYQNTKTDYDGAKSVAWTWASGGSNSPAGNPALKPADGNQTFTSGVTGSIAGFKLVKTETATLTAAADTKSGTSNTITAGSGALNDFTITTENAGTETAGTSFSVTSTARDAEQNTKTDYTAGHSVAWTWTATNSPSGNSPTKPANASETFTSGAMTKAGFTLVNAGETPTITITADAKSGTTGAITVNPAALNNFLVDMPASANSGEAFSTTITSRDVYYNTTKQVTGDTAIGVSEGSVNPTTLADTSFTDDGVWTGNITISDITEQPTVTLSATNGAPTGSDTISVLGIPSDPTGCSASRVSDTEFTITWSDNSSVETGYKIERKTDTGSGFSAYADVGSVGADVATFTDNSTNNPGDPPQADERYQYRVKAYNSIGDSANYSEDAVIHYTTPDTPSNVAGAYVNDTQFTVSYTDNAAVEDTHRIERCSNANCDGTYETNLGTFESSPQTDNTNIAANSRYRWRARAETPDSLVSSYGTSVYNYTTPTVPTIGAPAYVSDTEITVNWTDNSAYEDGFRVWVSEDGGAYAEITPGSNTVGADIQTYSYLDSSANHYYKFKVRAHTPNDLTAESGESAVVYTTPTAPTIGAPAYVSDTEITVNWTDNSAYEDGFKIERSVDGGAYSQIDTAAADAVSYSDTTASANHKYQYKIRSYKDSLDSDYSEASSEIYTTPAAPTIGAPAVDSPTAITWHWADNSNYEDSFRLDFVTGGGTDTDGIAANSTNHQTSGLNPNTQYAVHLHSYRDDRGESAASADSGAVYTFANIPAAPTVNNATTSTLDVNVNPNSNPAATEFAIYKETGATCDGVGGSYLAADGSDNGGTPVWQTDTLWGTVTAAELSENTQYSFCVKAKNGDNIETAFSVSASGTTNLSIPSDPTNTALSEITADSMKLTWTDNSSNEDGFKIEKSTNGISYDQIGMVSADTTEYTGAGTTSLSSNTQYYFRVRAYNASGDSGYSTASAKYTLANIPASLSLTADSSTQITASWNANSNPAGTEYYIENTTAGTNSGWTTNTYWVSSNLTCGTSYSFKVKARNGDDTETNYTDSASAETDGCGGGMPSAAYNPPSLPEPTPENPENNFSVLINNGDEYTNSETVTLKLNAGSDATRMAISNTPDFANASQISFQEIISWDLGKNIQYPISNIYTVYAKFYTQYGVASEVVSDSIILDTQPPEIKITEIKDHYFTDENIILKGAAEPKTKIAVRLDGEYFDGGLIRADNFGDWILNLGELPEGVHKLELKGEDRAGNIGETLTVNLIALSKEKSEEKPEEISEIAEEQKPAEQKPIFEEIPEKIEEIIEEIPETIEPFIPEILESEKPEEKPEEKKPEEIVAVPKKAPAAMEGKWNLLSREPISKFVLDPLPKGVESLAEKFPQLKETFKQVGISKASDLGKLENVKLALPGLAEMSRLPETKTALPKEIKIADLPASAKENIPEEVVFVKTGGELIDVGVDLTATDKGEIQQKFSAVADSYLTLAVKPESKAESVKGYVIFESGIKNRELGELEIKGNWKLEIGYWDVKDRLISLADSLTLLNNVYAQSNKRESNVSNIQSKLVLQEFEYADSDNDGIYTAKIKAPTVEGEYEIITVIEYEDPDLGTRVLRLTTVIDPEGYVYERNGNKETRIPNATVSLFWLNPQTGQYERWLSEKYQQKNPQTTDNTGKYSFLVPEGTYYLKVEAPGYLTHQSEPFEVKEDKGIHINIELKTKYGWLKGVDWKVIAIILLFALIVINFYRDRKRN